MTIPIVFPANHKQSYDLGESREDTRVWHSKGNGSARSGEKKAAVAIACVADVI